MVDGKPVAAKIRSAEKIVFGSAALPAGNTPLSLVVADDAKAGTADGEVIRVILMSKK